MERKIIQALIEGKGLKRICQEYKVGKDRVRTLRSTAIEYGYLNEARGPGNNPIPNYPEIIFPDSIDRRSLKTSEANQKLLEYFSWIEVHLQAGWHKVTVFEELPIKVSRSSFYRFLDRHKLQEVGRSFRRVVPEIIHKAGEALILDWGKLRDVVDEESGSKRTLWFLTGVMGHSRYMMVRLVWTNSVAVTLKAIESMFQELGGIPQKIISDNPKCFALEASRYEPLLNPALERFASHYGITMECLPPRDPQKKGKVERMITYCRRLYEAHGEAWHGLEESQEYLNKKMILANTRKHGTTMQQPINVFNQEEKIYLKPLPALAYEVEDYAEAVVRRDGHVRFQNKYYSVEEKFISEKVILLGNQTQVSIFHKGQLVEVHQKIIDAHQSKSTKRHHLKPWERSMQDDSFYRRRALKIGPHVEEMIIILIAQGHGWIDTRKVWGVLSLDKSFSKSQINLACQMAIEVQSYSYRTVRGFLQAQKTQPETKISDHKNNNKVNKFIRPLSSYQNELELN